MDCHFLLQGIFPTQGLNPGLLHCRQILYHLNQQGIPTLLAIFHYKRTRFIFKKKKVLIIECWKSSGFLFTHLSSISIKRGSQTLHGLFSGKQLWHMKLGEERGDQRTEPESVSQRRRKGLWEKELAPRAFGCSHPSKPLIYPAGRKGPSPAATREDESGSPWAGTATFPLACQRQRMDFKGLDMASHQPINLHVAFYRKNNLIFLIKK